ncbi:MAG: hypothetical protein DRH57_07330 [Candidatus Cloacimonadota bacterium]|nr:MAG: hypothetical protein DRH57_07330 [Candidatus Cloacimonadota bacterium]
MQLVESISTGLINVLHHKFRSILTLSGIIIGVASVVTMFSSVYGIQQLVKKGMESIGWNRTLIIYSNFPTDESRLKKYKLKKRFKPLNYGDACAIVKKVKNVEYIIPVTQSNYKAIVQDKSEKINFVGTKTEYLTDREYELAEGRWFTDFDNKRADKVCILGALLKEKLFGEKSALGEYVSANGIVFNVIGSLQLDKYSESNSGMQFNTWERRREHRSCFIPSKTASLYFRPNQKIDYLLVKAQSEDEVGKIYNQVKQIILGRHQMAHDIELQNIAERMLEITDMINKQMKNWNIILTSIAAISLFVGGIGLFSILLISINERMREIGVRKSVGATDFDIFTHFIVEAIALAVSGGLVGSMLAIFLTKILGNAIKLSFPIPYLGITIGMLFAIAVGFFSGLYPALKASRIDTIKAIFYFE